MASIVTLASVKQLENTLSTPLSLTRLLIHDIKDKSDTTKSFLQGRIKSIFGLVKHAKASMFYRKVTIEEDETQDQMHCMLTVEEKSAEQLRFLKEDTLAVGDLLVVVNVRFEPDPLFPSQGGANFYQALVNLSSPDCRVLLLKRSQDSSCKSNKRLEKVSAASTVVNRIVPAPKSQKKEPYAYVKLNNLVASTIVNVFGVVKFVRDPSKTRGLDYSMVITLVDELANGLTDKLKCVLFGNVSKLPSAKPGNIIRFHRLKITTYNGELQGQNGPGFSWVVFEGSKDASLSPIGTSHENITITEEDQERVKELRLWSASDTGEISLDRRTSCSLSAITTGQYFDLICQVVGTCVITEGESLLLKVWDGTRVKLKLYEQDMLFDNVISRLDLNDQLANRIRPYLVDVWVFDDHFGRAAEVKPGNFIRLQNLHAMKHKPHPEEEASPDSLSVELCLHHGTSHSRRLMILDPASKEVSELKQTLDRELAAVTDDSGDSFSLLLSESSVAPPQNVDSAGTTNRQIQDGIVECSSSSDDVDEFLTPRSQFVRSPLLSNGRADTLLCDVGSGEGAGAQHDAIVVSSSSSKTSTTKRTSDASDEAEAKCMRHDNSADIESDTGFPRGNEQASGSQVVFAEQLEKNVSSSGKNTVNAQLEDEILLSSENDLAIDGQKESEENEMSPVVLSLSPSLGFTRERCMLNTATVITGHHHINVMQANYIQKHNHPGKFRFQGYAMNYRPKSETASGFLQLFCKKCSFLYSIPCSDAEDKVESSELSENGRVPPLKSIEDEIRIYCCPECGCDLEYIYMVEFILTDGTEWICVQLWRQQANQFFGCTPLDLLQNPNRYRELIERLNLMCFGRSTGLSDDKPNAVAVNLSSQDPQKMECCLMSYQTPCGIAYQMFDTTFAADS